jgi:hypothetical protein
VKKLSYSLREATQVSGAFLLVLLKWSLPYKSCLTQFLITRGVRRVGLNITPNTKWVQGKLCLLIASLATFIPKKNHSIENEPFNSFSICSSLIFNSVWTYHLLLHEMVLSWSHIICFKEEYFACALSATLFLVCIAP